MDGVVSVRLRNRASGILSPPVEVPYLVEVTHGRQLTLQHVGPTGTLTPSGPITTSYDGQVIEGLDITGYLDVRHHVTVVNCRITGGTEGNSATYTIRHQRNLGKHLVLRHCEVIARIPTTRCMVAWGAATLEAEDCAWRGGTDNVYLEANTPVEGGYTYVFRRCWFGDLHRTPGSHTDAIQINGGTGGVLLDRCAVHAYALLPGEDPTTAHAVAENRASGGVILTYSPTAPIPTARVHLLDSYFDGANWTVKTSVSDGHPVPTDVIIQGNAFGLHHTYGPLAAHPEHIVSSNVWAASGTTTTGEHVVAGESVG